MPKIKLPRKSTHIDMTAMCDVAFLLLTFFMLATKFKPDEPVVVTTPASTSTKQIPEGFMQITLDKDGRVFFAVDNVNAKRDIINQINDDKKLGLSDIEKQNFVNGSGVGVPFSQLKSYLALAPNQRAEYDKKAPGIPTDTTGDFTTNELAYWVQTARYHVDNGKGRIAIKADGKASYPNISKVISTLGKQKVFRFSFITDMKGVPPGTALAAERAGQPAPAE
ncbi:ExbD/TolR family protein [Taibaiella helva]|uniref:ExbD/TolR family protein n=1 Tax=Taibaiella helva TaxID=2301235 RepID=UPI000E56B096|nr:biopolymer transporter ExbD [Taibaiella helva]